MTIRAFGAAVALAAAMLAPQLARAATCAELGSMKFEDGAVTSAQSIAAGAFYPPDTPRTPIRYDVGWPRYDYLPSFCRITAAFSGDLKIEVWLPAEPWNGEFNPQSGGLLGGKITGYANLAASLMTGAATAIGNSGIDSVAEQLAPGTTMSNARWLAQHPEKIATLGDSIHRMVVRSKAIIGAYYGRAPSLTYMADRAARDPFLLAQRYPEDLDAVAVNGPIIASTRHTAYQMWAYNAVHETPESFIQPEKLPALHDAVLKACDDLDGAHDRIIENPRKCRFDPATMLCTSGDRNDCLTAPQIAAVRKIYSPVRDPRTNALIFEGMELGSELEWPEIIGPRPYPFGEHYYREFVFKDPNWDPKTRHANQTTDYDLANAPQYRPLNADDPNLGPFFARGGKVVLIGGWADQRIAPGLSIDYYESVLKAVGPKARDSFRLFMVPGMLHYPLGGDRQSDYALDAASAVKTWFRTGKAPDQMVGIRYVGGRTAQQRLVCAWPNSAHYNGKGATDDPNNFSCRP